MQRAIVLANGAAGRGHNQRRMTRVERVCAELGVEVVRTGSAEETRQQARRAAEQGYTRVIAAGGDGTVHWVLNGLAGTGAALGIIPLGSGNDMAVNLGIPLDVEAATRVAVGGTVRRADLGLLKVQGPRSKVQGQEAGASKPTLDQFFGCIASFGLDSHANRIANRHQRLHGTLIYIYALLRSLIEYRVPQVTIRGDIGEFSGAMMLVAAANAPSYGGGMRLAPHAQMADGMLDLCVVSNMSRLKLLRCFPEVYFGTHLRHREITCLRTARFRLEADRPLEVFADGEYLGLTPAEVEVLPGALAFVAPK
ncbi:MAG: diacylglycerol kinase family lipid kinase [Acidobacteria bacterium]|jgi:diacylglycerol kinase (ATP)|nr:diacylglycerol kinase family lipid kinase [Acidobacteriota bacterium]